MDRNHEKAASVDCSGNEGGCSCCVCFPTEEEEEESQSEEEEEESEGDGRDGMDSQAFTPWPD